MSEQGVFMIENGDGLPVLTVAPLDQNTRAACTVVTGPGCVLSPVGARELGELLMQHASGWGASKPERQVLYAVCGAHGHESPDAICVTREQAEAWVQRQPSPLRSGHYMIDEYVLDSDGAYT